MSSGIYIQRAGDVHVQFSGGGAPVWLRGLKAGAYDFDASVLEGDAVAVELQSAGGGAWSPALDEQNIFYGDETSLTVDNDNYISAFASKTNENVLLCNEIAKRPQLIDNYIQFNAVMSTYLSNSFTTVNRFALIAMIDFSLSNSGLGLHFEFGIGRFYNRRGETFGLYNVINNPAAVFNSNYKKWTLVTFIYDNTSSVMFDRNEIFSINQDSLINVDSFSLGGIHNIGGSVADSCRYRDVIITTDTSTLNIQKNEQYLIDKRGLQL